MSNSSLVTYTNISPNKNTPRNHTIDTITIHCFVGQVTAKQGADVFKPTSKKASCNYVVGKDGSIGLVVDEADRSWCSSSSENDNRAVTIEVASESKEPYKITDLAMNALIKLCADICKRNNIDKLIFSTSKDDRVNHRNGVNMTCHRDFANKSCPGAYIYERLYNIADEVNALLYSKGDKLTTEYTVKAGDTLTAIASSYECSVDEIVLLNKIQNKNKIRVNDVLIIPLK